jgi:Zn-dependent protease with chaperone function
MADPALPGNLELRLRMAALRALETVYHAGAAVCLGATFVGGGFVPVLRGWLQDQVESWSDLTQCLGAVRRDVASASPDADHGPVLARADAPALFDEIDEISRRLGVKRPNQVRAAYLPCCGITAWNRRQRERALLIGLPLLEILSPAELRAVVAHELAHLAYGDMAGSARALRFWESLAHAVDTGHAAGLPARWARHCLVPGMRLLRPVARGQEIRADRAAASLAGGHATASALVKVAMVQGLFREVLAHYDPSDPDQANLYAFFRRFWSDLPTTLLESLRHAILTHATPPRPDDPHPPLLDRLSVVQDYPDRPPNPGPLADEPAVLGDLEALEQMLHNRIFGVPADGPSVFHRTGSA